MANIALITANKVEIVEVIQSLRLVALEAIVAGAPVRLDTATGKAANSNGTTAPEARVIGIATRTVAGGEALTVLKQGVMDGFVLAGAYDSPVYLSDTDATLADSAGTVSTVVGRVVPGNANQIGVGADKLLLVQI